MTYHQLFLDTAYQTGNYLAPLSLMFLFLGRILPIIALSPFFGAKVLPHPVKMTLALSFFAIFFPHLLFVTTTPLTFNLFILILLIKEAFIGLLLGFLISIPFTIAQSAGMFIDHQRGGSSLMVNDPTIQNQSSPLGTIFNLVLILLFFFIDGPFLFIDAIIKSYEIVPPDRFITPLFFQENAPFWPTLVTLINNAVKIAAQLATPPLMMILMTDMFLGIANRLAPQVQVTFLGFSLKSFLGLVMVYIGWKLFVKQMVFETYNWLQMIENVIPLLKPS